MVMKKNNSLRFALLEKNILRILLIFLLLLVSSHHVADAQDGWSDTLKAAVKTDAMKVARDIVSQIADVEAIRAVVTPLG